MPRHIAVFEPQEINGQTVEPLCVPQIEDDNLSSSVAAATNLLWFSFHITLANRNPMEARRILKMLRAVIEDEVEDDFFLGLEDTVKLLEAHVKAKNEIDKRSQTPKKGKKPRKEP